MNERIGKELLRARLAQSISIEEVAHKTRIPAQRICEMESGDFTGFAGMTYARGFLSLYGSFLEVDVREALAELEAESQQISESGHYADLQPDDELRNEYSRPSPFAGHLPVILLFGLVALIVAFPVTYVIVDRKIQKEKNAPIELVEEEPDNASPQPRPVRSVSTPLEPSKESK